MNVDSTVAWLLELATTLDAVLEGDGIADHDSVYTLVGLVTELDAHLRGGGALPTRWAAAKGAHGASPSRSPRPVWLVLEGGRAENDREPRSLAPEVLQGAHDGHGEGRAARVKRLDARARRRASALERAGQLALPFAPA